MSGAEIRYRLIPHAFITDSSLERLRRPNVTRTLKSAASGMT